MYESKVKPRFDYLNRLIILMLTGIGLGIDGFQSADPLFGISVAMWLFLDELTHVEVFGLNYCYRLVKAEPHSSKGSLFDQKPDAARQHRKRSNMISTH